MNFNRWYKLKAKAAVIKIKDIFSNDKFSQIRSAQQFTHFIEIKQPFKSSATLEQKKHNLIIAAERIRKHLIMPGEVFSFWRAVGNPNKNEFAASRSIRKGKLMLEKGGGLCQASGIIYHLSLIAGLDIIERYNHSKDLYTEETRFCPLGSDATVAYGYRDLRVKNNLNTPVYFDLIVEKEYFCARLYSKEMLDKHEIHFEYQMKHDNILEAMTIDKTNGNIIATSIYERYE
jgi:vancomycin resistance protein VanW